MYRPQATPFVTDLVSEREREREGKREGVGVHSADTQHVKLPASPGCDNAQGDLVISSPLANTGNCVSQNLRG